MIQLPVNIFNFIILTSVIIGIVFGLLLIFTKRINQRTNRFLGFVPIIISLWNCWVLGVDFGLYSSFNSLNWIPLHYSLALGPCIFFYTKHITDSAFRFRKGHLVHFLPVLIEFFIALIQGYESTQKALINYETYTFLYTSPILQLASIISVLVYTFYALKMINAYHRWVKANYSDESKYKLKWLYRLITIFSILWFLWVPYSLIDYLVFDYELGISDYYPLYILMALITILISIEAFLKPEVILLEDKQKIRKESLIPSKEIFQQASWLKKEMEINLFYLNSELTLNSLANELDMHPNNVSRIINEGLQKSFSDFVNDYRTDAVVTKLRDSKYDHNTLLGIAFESGFNSKTTFNRVFKKATGKTPFEFKKQLKKD